MSRITLIADPAVLTIPIQENNDPLVDVIGCKDLRFDDEHGQIHTSSLIRRAVLEKLLAAQKSLPSGLQLQIREGYRPIEVQQSYWEEYCSKLKTTHPTWSVEQIRDEAMRFVAPPDIVPPHSTGGAVDLTILDTEGKSLNMGTDMNDSEASFAQVCYTASASISAEARKNRDILIKAMTEAGFVNYPTEWWHWSYGDRYWAYQIKAQYAIYGTVLNKV